MYEAGKILYVGGGDPPTNSAEIIDLNQANPTWRYTGNMAYARRHHNATVLPTGDVLVTGGTSGSGFNNVGQAVRGAELWHQATGTWTTMASSSVARIYHGAALLLPDGRVLYTGSGARQTVRTNRIMNCTRHPTCSRAHARRLRADCRRVRATARRRSSRLQMPPRSRRWHLSHWAQ